MIAVDTNLVVRILTNDDPAQTEAARNLFAVESVWIAKTVFLESAWVLRSVYGFEEDAIRSAFIRLLGLKNLRIEDEASVLAALALTAEGVDFADAMHLSSRPTGAVFASFDRVLVKRARRAGVTEIRGIKAT